MSPSRRTARAPMTDLASRLSLLAALAIVAFAACAADVRRGEYLIHAGGCVGCHTEEKKGATRFGGGRALKTPFGIFYGPNITPHPQAGIGRWSESDFVRAMRHGRRPDGSNYFPAFPYPSFTQISDADLQDMWAYLRTLAPSDHANRPHALRFPYGWRAGVTVWKWLFFRPGPFVPMSGASAAVNRGAYLTLALGHCGECHTPRNFLGGPMKSRKLAGGKGLGGTNVPNLTPAGLELWSDAELKEFFTTGITREGDTVSEEMDEVVRNTTSRLTAEDLAAMISYLRSLAPIAAKPR